MVAQPSPQPSPVPNPQPRIGSTLAFVIGIAPAAALAWAMLADVLRGDTLVLAGAAVLLYPFWVAWLGRVSASFGVSIVLGAVPSALGAALLVLELLRKAPFETIRWGDALPLVPSLIVALLVIPVGTRIAARRLWGGHPWRALVGSVVVVAVGFCLAAMPMFFVVILMSGHTSAA